jgi:hypothetical protein
LTPEFIPLSIEINEGGRKFETIDRRQFAPYFFLDIKTDEKDPVTKFVFELVHDGLQLGAGNSVRGLEFQQDRFALPDHGLHRLGVFH